MIQLGPVISNCRQVKSGLITITPPWAFKVVIDIPHGYLTLLVLPPFNTFTHHSVVIFKFSSKNNFLKWLFTCRYRWIIPYYYLTISINEFKIIRRRAFSVKEKIARKPAHLHSFIVISKRQYGSRPIMRVTAKVVVLHYDHWSWL